MTDVLSAAPVREALADFAETMTETLDSLLPASDGPEGRLYEAMRYSALGTGKFIRPYLVKTSGRMFEVSETSCLRAGAAVELIHTYSLIHDDLPAMDDDDMRRGRRSCHIAYDEATAILAGDALLTLAFEVLADETTHPDAGVRSALVTMLAARAGGQICCPEPAAPEPHRPEAGDHRLPEAAIGLPYRLLLAHRDGQVEELAQFT